jgi:uncharacterized protein (DUF362 family)
MAKFVWTRTRLVVTGLIGALVLGGGAIYWKLFGGKAKELKPGEYVVGATESSDLATENTEVLEMEEEEREQLVVVRNDDVEKAIEEIVKRTGDFDFIKPGQTVLVKPNLNSGNPYPATTNPVVVAKVVELAYQKGAKKVIVGDFSGIGNPGTMRNFKSSGILGAASDAGAEVLAFDEVGEWEKVKPQGATHWPNGFKISKLLFEVDHLISLPVLKRHVLADYTLALKNMVGIISAADRLLLHASKDLPEKIAEISLVVKPSIIIVDGTKGFISGGPDVGEAVEINTFVGTFDPVAADIAGLNILKEHGAKLKEPEPWNQRQVRQALKSRLNILSKEEIKKQIEEQVS